MGLIDKLSKPKNKKETQDPVLNNNIIPKSTGNTSENMQKAYSNLENTNIFKRLGKQIGESEKEYLKQQEEYHKSLKDIENNFKNNTKNINEQSKKEITLILERYKKTALSKTELDFIKNKIETFRKPLNTLEDQDQEASESYLDKYMFKYKRKWNEELTEEQEKMIGNFIENFLFAYTDYIKNTQHIDLKNTFFEQLHKGKEGLKVSWREAFTEIISENDELVDKLDNILEKTGKETIDFKIKYLGNYEEFTIKKEALIKIKNGEKEQLEITTADTINNNNEKTKESNEINTQALADEIALLMRIEQSEKNLLLDFLSHYTERYPKTKDAYIKLLNITQSLPHVSTNTKNEITQLITLKQSEISDTYEGIEIAIDKANISEESEVFLQDLIIDLKENGITEESFIFEQIGLHEKLQRKMVEIEKNYIYDESGIHDDIYMLQKEPLGENDITYIENKMKEITTNTDQIIQSEIIQSLIQDENKKIKEFKTMLLTLYINQKNNNGEDITIQQINKDEEKFKKIVDNNNRLQKKKEEILKEKSKITIKIGKKIEIKYEKDSVLNKLKEQEYKSNFNLIEFIDTYGIPESVKEVIHPLINELLIEEKKKKLFSKDVDETSSWQDIAILQQQFHEVGLYNGKIDGKYDSIKNSIKIFQINNSIIYRSNSTGKGRFGPKTKEAFNKYYINTLKQREYKHIDPKIEERIKMLYIYFLYSWSKGEKGKKSGYLSNELKQGLFGYEIYNHNEKYQKALRNTKSFYERKKQEIPDWLSKELNKLSAQQWITSNNGKKEIKNTLFGMNNNIKATHILQNLGKGDFRTPINLTAEQQMIVFTANLNTHNKQHLYDIFIDGNMKNIDQLHKKHFNKNAPNEKKTFDSKKTNKQIMEEVMTHIRKYTNKETKIPVVQYQNFDNTTSQGLGWNLTTITPRGLKNSCGASVYGLLKKANVHIDNDVIPVTGRDGYRWEKFLDKGVQQKTFVKVKIDHPNEAKPGGIVVYRKGALGSIERIKYGHVEIKGGDGNYYSYYKSDILGGSTFNTSKLEYEKKVIKGTIQNPYLFKEITGFTGYVYYPIQSSKT